MTGNQPANAPHLKISIEGGASTVYYSSFDLILSGELAQKFSESYKQQLDIISPQFSPHPENFVYKGGQFNDYDFTFTLFSGCFFNGHSLDTGQQIDAVVNGLANLAKPSWQDSGFITSPLCRVQICRVGGNLWQARGYFHTTTVTWRGSFDEEGFPTVVDVNMGFRRHFGDHGQAANSQILAARVTCDKYIFSTG